MPGAARLQPGAGTRQLAFGKASCLVGSHRVEGSAMLEVARRQVERLHIALGGIG